MKALTGLVLLAWSGLACALDPGQTGTLTQTAAVPLTQTAAVPLTQAAGVPRASYLEATGGLMLVILLILGLGWVVKRMGMVPGSKGMVRILGGVALGGRERALILEAEGKRILVGVAPGQVQLLLRLDEAEAAAQAAEPAGSAGPGQKGRGQIKAESKVEPSSQAFAAALAEANNQIESTPSIDVRLKPSGRAD